MSPVTGVVAEVNEKLTSTPKIINSNPEGDGWFAKIKVEGTSEFDALLDEAGYKALVEDEGEH